MTVKSIQPSVRSTEPRGELRVLASPLNEPDSLLSVLGSSAPWVCDAKGALTHNLHELASELLRKPENKDFLKKYLAIHEGAASRDLAAAISARNGDLLSAVAYRYRFTPSGENAARLAARFFVDKGEPVTAALFMKGWLRDQQGNWCEDSKRLTGALAAAKIFADAGFRSEFTALKEQLATCEKLEKREKTELEKLSPSEGKYESFQKSWREHLSDGIRPDRPIPDSLRLALVFGAPSKELPEFFSDRVSLTPLCSNLDPLPDLESQLAFIDQGGVALYPLRFKGLLPQFSKMLREPRLPFNGLHLLSRLGEQAVPLLVEGLHDQSHQVRYRSANALAMMGEKAVSAVPDLINAIPTADVDTQMEIARALTDIGPGSKAAIPALIQLHKKGDLRVTGHVLRALARYGEDSLPAVPVFVHALAYGDPERREVARQGVVNVGESALAPLLDYLKSPGKSHWEVEAVARVIGDFRELAKPAVPELMRYLSPSDSDDMKLAAISSLGKIGKPAEAAIPALRKFREGNDRQLSQAASQALYYIEKGVSAP